MFTNVPKCDTFFCDSTPFEGAFGTNVTFVTLDPPPVLYNEKIAMNFQLEDMLRPCGRIESILLYIEVADTSTRLLRSSNQPPSP